MTLFCMFLLLLLLFFTEKTRFFILLPTISLSLNTKNRLTAVIIGKNRLATIRGVAMVPMGMLTH